MHSAAWRLLLCAAAAALATSTAAVGAAAASEAEDEAAALALPDAALSADPARSGALTSEAAATLAEPRGGADADAQRLSLDARYSLRPAADWRAVFAARLDLNWAGSLASAQPIGTLKQAYLSWQPEPSLLLDLGRINARQGVALGYNPTDFFRAGAVRSVVSLDPDSLRENRMGTVMWRGEQLWDSGALTAIFAPRLSGHANSAPLDADLGATNAHARWLLALSQRIAPGWTPQWLAYGAAGQPLQLGMSLTAVLAQSLVAELEFSGGRLRSQWSQALDLPGTAAPRSRAATGVTYSAVQKLSLSLEYEYDGAGLGYAGWRAARAGEPLAYGRYRAYVLGLQELPTRSNVFLYASWQDLLLRHLDLGAFLREDITDGSRLPWTELRYHWRRSDLALRWQAALGSPSSDFGAAATTQSWQVLWDCYL